MRAPTPRLSYRFGGALREADLQSAGEGGSEPSGRATPLASSARTRARGILSLAARRSESTSSHPRERTKSRTRLGAPIVGLCVRLRPAPRPAPHQTRRRPPRAASDRHDRTPIAPSDFVSAAPVSPLAFEVRSQDQRFRLSSPRGRRFSQPEEKTIIAGGRIRPPDPRGRAARSAGRAARALRLALHFSPPFCENFS